MNRFGIAYQLYSAREEAKEDLSKVLAAIKSQGYEGVEFAGFYGHSAEKIKKLLLQHGLKAVSSHVPLSTLREDPFGVISFHQKIDCHYIAIPYLEPDDRPGSPNFAKLIGDIYFIGKLCREGNIQLLYHNHDFEFEVFSGGFALDFLFSAIPANLLQTEIDTCWVLYAGIDPAAYLLQYKERAPLVHIKDFVGFKGDSSPYQLMGQKNHANTQIAEFSYRPLGYGVQNLPALIDSALKAGAKWLIIEQDESPDRPPLDASVLSIQTLKKYL